jgi:hypothetical protein
MKKAAVRRPFFVSIQFGVVNQQSDLKFIGIYYVYFIITFTAYEIGIVINPAC